MPITRIECVRDAVKVASLKDDFDRLGKGAVMQRLAWLLPWFEAYQATHSLHVLVAYNDNRVTGILPLAETNLAVIGRSLVFMGSGKTCSDDLGILAEDCDSQQVAESFAAWLVQSPDCCRWDHLDLDGVRESNQTMKIFQSRLESLTGHRFERKASPNCWSTSLAGGLDEYKKRLTKRARKIVREAESAVNSNVGKFEMAQTLEQALGFLEDIEQMHQARWQEQGIEGCFSTQQFSSFLKSAIRALWNDPWSLETHSNRTESIIEEQRVQIGLLRIDGQPAAGCVCFRDRGALAMYLTGMNPAFAESRPGWMLNTCIIKHAIELGCSRFDFLRGDEEYKERLGGEPTVQDRLIIPANRLTSQARNFAYRTAVNLKGWWNSSVAHSS